MALSDGKLGDIEDLLPSELPFRYPSPNHQKPANHKLAELYHKAVVIAWLSLSTVKKQ